MAASKNAVANAYLSAIKSAAQSGGKTQMSSKSMVQNFLKGFVQSKTGIKL